MPDRAVVEDVCPLNDPNFPTGHGWGHAGDDGWRDCRCGARAFDPRDVREPELIERDRQTYAQFMRSQQPRALVAISEDQETLVVLDPEPVERGGRRDVWWSVIGWNGVWWEDDGFTEDTGQSADAVLREWMESRDA